MVIEKPSFTKRPDNRVEVLPNELAGKYINIHSMRKRNSNTPPSYPVYSIGNAQPRSFHAGRPIPRDANVPEGFERSDSGMIVPEHPRPSGSVRYEGQHPDDTKEEHLVRMKRDNWNFAMACFSLVLLSVNIVFGVLSAFDYSIGFPVGFIPLPLVIWAFIKKSKYESKLRNMKRERETEEIMKQSINRIGTTTVRR